MNLTEEILSQCKAASGKVAFKFAKELECLYAKGNMEKQNGNVRGAIPVLTFAMFLEIHSLALENAYHSAGNKKVLAEFLLQEAFDLAMQSIKIIKEKTKSAKEDIN